MDKRKIKIALTDIYGLGGVLKWGALLSVIVCFLVALICVLLRNRGAIGSEAAVGAIVGTMSGFILLDAVALLALWGRFREVLNSWYTLEKGSIASLEKKGLVCRVWVDIDGQKGLKAIGIFGPKFFALNGESGAMLPVLWDGKEKAVVLTGSALKKLMDSDLR